MPLKGNPLLEVGIFVVKMARHQWRSHSNLLFVTSAGRWWLQIYPAEICDAAKMELAYVIEY